MDGEAVGLARYTAAIRRRGWLVLACMVLFAIAAFGYTASQPTMYEATAKVLIKPYSSASFNEPVFTSEQVATQVEVIQSLSVATPVVGQLGLAETPTDLLKTVTVAAQADTSVVLVTVSRTSAGLAAQIANALGESYLEFRAASQPASARNETTGEIISLAQPPRHAAGRSPLVGGVLGGIVGLVLGCVAAIALAARDKSVGDEAQLARATGGLPVLGRIPKSRPGPRRLALLDDPRSTESLAYRFLATTVRVLDKARQTGGAAAAKPTVVLVASAAPGDGRTSVAANLALAAAADGQRVLVCDMDVTNPALTTLLGLPGSDVTLDRALAGTAAISPDRLPRPAPRLLALGTQAVPVDHPLPLAGGQFARLVGSLSQVVDLVVVDSAPLLSSPEALGIVPDADLLLLIVRERASKASDIDATLQRIRHVGGSVTGVVVSRSSSGGGTQRSSRRRASSPKAVRSASTPVAAAASTPPTDLSRR